MVGAVDMSNSFAAFEKMEEKVAAMEAEAEAAGVVSIFILRYSYALLICNAILWFLKAYLNKQTASWSHTIALQLLQ